MTLPSTRCSIVRLKYFIIQPSFIVFTRAWSMQVKNGQLRVRPVEQRDAAQLQQHCFPLNSLEETELQISAALQAFVGGGEITLVAEVLGAVVGPIPLQRQTHRLRRHRATLSGLVVHEPYQGQGIARA